MQKKTCIILLLAIAAVAVMFTNNSIAVTEATNGGASANIDEVYCDLRELVRGSVGTIIGFLFALGGLILLLLKGSNYGIVLIIIGISVTAFPGLINSVIVGISTASSESADISGIDNATINSACSSGGEFPSVNTLPDGSRINAITRGTNAPAEDTSLLPCAVPGFGPC
ncbi:MAG: hypothetical protein VX730_06550 [Pseudomonadota bacterium]|nr:hypothetical protein [Pseudomonadota bacterium]